MFVPYSDLGTRAPSNDHLWNMPIGYARVNDCALIAIGLSRQAAAR
jgi:hypothetical protein